MSEQPEQTREELRGTTKHNTRVTASVTPQPPTPPHGPTTEKTQREDGARTREARNNQTSNKIIEFRTYIRHSTSTETDTTLTVRDSRMMPSGQQTFFFAKSESRLGHVVNLIYCSHQNSLADRRRKPNDDSG